MSAIISPTRTDNFVSEAGRRVAPLPKGGITNPKATSGLGRPRTFYGEVRQGKLDTFILNCR